MTALSSRQATQLTYIFHHKSLHPLWLMLSEVHGRNPFYYAALIHSIRSIKWR